MARLTSQSYVKIALIILLILALFSVACLGSCSSWRPWSTGHTTQMLGNANVNVDGIKNIEIDWAAGSVSVAVGEGDQIQLIETSNGLLSKAQTMRWLVAGDTLKIDYGSGWSCMSLASKHLEVRVPNALAKNIGVLSIDGVSGDYAVKEVSCDTLQVQLASGKLDAQSVQARQLDLDAASGTMRVGGVFADSIRASVASGRAEVTCDNVCPKAIKADMASGNVMLAIPDNPGFTARVDKMSGSFSSDFELTMQGDRHYLYKNGEASFDFDMASGSLTLRKSS